MVLTTEVKIMVTSDLQKKARSRLYIFSDVDYLTVSYLTSIEALPSGGRALVIYSHGYMQ